MNPLAAALCPGEVLLLQGWPKLANRLKQQGVGGIKTNLETVLQNTLYLKETASIAIHAIIYWNRWIYFILVRAATCYSRVMLLFRNSSVHYRSEASQWLFLSIQKQISSAAPPYPRTQKRVHHPLAVTTLSSCNQHHQSFSEIKHHTTSVKNRPRKTSYNEV